MRKERRIHRGHKWHSSILVFLWWDQRVKFDLLLVVGFSLFLLFARFGVAGLDAVSLRWFNKQLSFFFFSFFFSSSFSISYHLLTASVGSPPSPEGHTPLFFLFSLFVSLSNVQSSIDSFKRDQSPMPSHCYLYLYFHVILISFTNFFCP